MSIPGNANSLLLTTTAETGYQVSRSLRFNSSDSAYLSRTPASAGNRKTWTWAGWVKRSGSGLGHFWSCDQGSGASNYGGIRFDSDAIRYFEIIGGSFALDLTTNAVFRDFSAWYHIQLVVDTTQATAANRVKLYINNVQQTFTGSSYPAQNTDLLVNTASYPHSISSVFANSRQAYFDGYLADIHFIDGQALTPSSFTEVSATTGQLIPKAYTGTFGTNGFWLKFSDNSNNTAATLGKDYSPNGNNWTPNNLSVTAGAGNDSLVDTPTSYGTDTGAGGEVRGNYATFSPITTSGQGLATLANGNLDISGTGSSYTGCVSTIAVSSGKWYWEYTVTAVGTSNGAGIVATDSLSSANGATWGYAASANCWFRRTTGGGTGAVASNNSDVVSSLSGLTTNDVMNIAFDADSGKLWFGKNGTWDSSGNPATGANPTVTVTMGGKSFYAFAQAYGTWSGVLNAGARPFAYTAPSGFKALCDTNLPAPVVAKPSTVMDVALYTGNGTNRNITGFGFSPDLVWIKSRSSGTLSHALFDTVRGVNLGLQSNATTAETSDSVSLTAFNSDGFSLGTGNTYFGVNTSSATFVAWAFDAGTTTSSNVAGSITSSVRANTSAGFSVVTYTGNGSSGATVGHGLGVAPAFFVVKRRNAADSWLVYHSFTGNTKYLLLNNTTAAATYSGAWNDAGPSSTTITLGNDVGVNANGGTYVCYAWAPLSGYSSFGSYTGNGSADGPFVYTGFRPRWVMYKDATNVNVWVIVDATRQTYNVIGPYLLPNASDAEGSTTVLDMLSNGFKIRVAGASANTASATIIYAAFAENPFQYARAR